jgi:hypothetical protein
MTELDLYKWVTSFEPEWRWDTNPDTKHPDVILWISVYAIESFLNLLPNTVLDEGGVSARLVDKNIAVWMSEICEECDINMENVFEKDK